MRVRVSGEREVNVQAAVEAAHSLFFSLMDLWLCAALLFFERWGEGSNVHNFHPAEGRYCFSFLLLPFSSSCLRPLLGAM